MGRLRSEPARLARALGIATAIASELRDLHAEGRAHGAVELESLRVSPSGISLGGARGAHDEAAMAEDIVGYGRMLNSMLTGSPELQPPLAIPRNRRGAEALRAAALEHAHRCISGQPGIQRVVTEVRLLGVLARQIPQTEYEDPLLNYGPDWELSMAPAVDSRPAPIPPRGGEPCPNCGGVWPNRSRFRAGLNALLARFGRPIHCPACQQGHPVDPGAIEPGTEQNSGQPEPSTEGFECADTGTGDLYPDDPVTRTK